MKTTFIYRIDLGKNNRILRTEYCYARNKKTAEAYYKDKYHSEKYDYFDAIAFGTADIRKHPGPIEELLQDEVDYIRKHDIGNGGPYPYRNTLPKGEFVSVEKAGELL